MAGVFQVMAFSVGALEKGESDEVFMGKLAKIATAEIISSKVCIVKADLLLKIFVNTLYSYTDLRSEAGFLDVILKI